MNDYCFYPQALDNLDPDDPLLQGDAGLVVESGIPLDRLMTLGELDEWGEYEREVAWQRDAGAPGPSYVYDERWAS